MSLLTEEDVRKMFSSGKIKAKSDMYITDNQLITPSAREYLIEKKINIKRQENSMGDDKLVKSESGHKTLTAKTNEDTEINEKNGMYDTLFGAKLTEKPEHMTHLRGNLLVFKDHPKIAFRGAIDSLQSEIIVFQILAGKQNMKQLVDDLEEILKFIQLMIRYDITGDRMDEFNLQGLSAKELREHSHHPSQYYGMKHFIPSYKQGEIVAHLNKLRTKTRETELVAYKAFKDEYGQVNREDIIRGLNRLSSLFWIMMFKYLTKKYET